MRHSQLCSTKTAREHIKQTFSYASRDISGRCGRNQIQKFNLKLITTPVITMRCKFYNTAVENAKHKNFFNSEFSLENGKVNSCLFY